MDGTKKLGNGSIRLIDNFLPEFTHQRIYTGVAKDKYFPYYYHEVVTYDNNNEKEDVRQLSFVHGLYSNKKIASPWFDKLALPLIDKLEIAEGKLLRVKVNLNPNQIQPVTSQWHVDYKKSNYETAIYYCNTNNGYTELESGEKIKSIANRITIFDGQLKHRGVTQTDTKGRFVININYETH